MERPGGWRGWREHGRGAERLEEPSVSALCAGAWPVSHRDSPVAASLQLLLHAWLWTGATGMDWQRLTLCPLTASLWREQTAALLGWEWLPGNRGSHSSTLALQGLSVMSPRSWGSAEAGKPWPLGTKMLRSRLTHKAGLTWCQDLAFLCQLLGAETVGPFPLSGLSPCPPSLVCLPAPAAPHPAPRLPTAPGRLRTPGNT